MGAQPALARPSPELRDTQVCSARRAARGLKAAIGRPSARAPLQRFVLFLPEQVDDGVEDLIQRTMLNCVKAPEKLRDRSSFRSYMFTVARHELRRVPETAARRQTLTPTAVRGMMGTSLAAWSPDATSRSSCCSAQRFRRSSDRRRTPPLGDVGPEIAKSSGQPPTAGHRGGLGRRHREMRTDHEQGLDPPYRRFSTPGRTTFETTPCRARRTTEPQPQPTRGVKARFVPRPPCLVSGRSALHQLRGRASRWFLRGFRNKNRESSRELDALHDYIFVTHWNKFQVNLLRSDPNGGA